MLGIKRIVSCVFAILILGLISFVFFQALENLHSSVRWIAVVLVFVVCGSAGWFFRAALKETGAIKYWLLGLVALFGVALYTASSPEFQSADFAQVNYSNGTHSGEIKPVLKRVWNRAVAGYDMHPAFESIVVPNALVATFASSPKQVQVMIAKPPAALLQPDGKLIESNGLSIEVNAFDSQGKLGYSKTLSITQEDFLKDKWIKKKIRMDAGVSSIEVKLGWGTPGSISGYGSTIVGFQIPSAHAYVDYLGKIMLLCAGFFVVLFGLYFNLDVFRAGSASPRKASSLLTVGNCFLVLLGLCLLGYYIHSKTSFVFFWDLRNYWSKTEFLYELINAGAWKQAVGVFSSTYTLDYSMLPAVLPALLSSVTGYPTRVNYSLSIIAIYAVPAYLMVAYLGKRLVDGSASGSGVVNDGRWVFASFAVFLALPLYFATTLNLMPDIGGVVLFVAALLSASSIVEALRAKDGHSQPWKVSNSLIRSSVNLGVLFSLMFVFRRWYVFAAAGIAFALSVLIVIEVLTSRGLRAVVISRVLVAAIVAIFSALPFMCWVLFDWSRDFGQHDYANLYSSYKFSLERDGQVALLFLGTAAPLLSILGAVLLYRFGKARHLWFLLLTSTIVACTLFLHIQSPAPHHYFLLMPMLGALIAGLGLLLLRRFGFKALLGYILVFAVGGGLATYPMSAKYGVTYFAGFDTWYPKQQKYVQGYTEMYRWLTASENQQKTICLIASSEAINQGVLGELWQVVPGATKNAYDQRLIQLGQVDSVNGPPQPIIKQCQIFLVGVPFQAHLQPSEQLTLGIVQKDMVEGQGVGVTVDRNPTVFAMGDNIQVLGYTAVRSITEEEYQDLVKRFLEIKAAAVPK